MSTYTLLLHSVLKHCEHTPPSIRSEALDLTFGQKGWPPPDKVYPRSALYRNIYIDVFDDPTLISCHHA